ncbi:MAG TPA: ATPase domain-containing protein, partial [Candidatus Nanoarchaeia archaeon]|nr:ATPase domain-containing protein [Candidatus Nanoarchaeia archaeon]
VGLSGPPGVGKSIFTLHFLLQGARQGQKCVYINLEEPEGNIINMINQFEFSKEFLDFVDKEKIVIRCFTYPEYEKIYSDLFQKIREDNSINRLVIDSFNCFFPSAFNPESLSLSGEVNIRRMINQAFSMFRRKGLTTILILEMQLDKQTRFYYNIPHLVDGIINLDFLELGAIERRIFIPKMRWTNQYRESKSYEINKKGIVVRGE